MERKEKKRWFVQYYIKTLIVQQGVPGESFFIIKCWHLVCEWSNWRLHDIFELSGWGEKMWRVSKVEEREIPKVTVTVQKSAWSKVSSGGSGLKTSDQRSDSDSVFTIPNPKIVTHNVISPNLSSKYAAVSCQSQGNLFRVRKSLNVRLILYQAIPKFAERKYS